MKTSNLGYAKKLLAATLICITIIATVFFLRYERKSLELRTEAITFQLNIIAKSISILKHNDVSKLVKSESTFSEIFPILQKEKLIREYPVTVYGSGDYNLIWENEEIAFLTINDVSSSICDSMDKMKKGEFFKDAAKINDALDIMNDKNSIFCFNNQGSFMLAKKI